jgi:hypothetical protein
MKKYLESNMEDLLEGKKIRKNGFVYWVNSAHMIINAMSEEEWDSGVINGYKIAEINEDYTVTITDKDFIQKKSVRDGWHKIKGMDVYVENGKVVRGTKLNGQLPAYPYEYVKEYGCYRKVSGISFQRFCSRAYTSGNIFMI